jgi:copper homeostasis protein
MSPVLVEACVATMATAFEAESAGAARLELCDDRAEGGTTPDPHLLARVRRGARLPVHVLIRPRGGNFVYTPGEGAAMLREIAQARQAGADGVVIGALDREGDVATGLVEELIEAARPGAVTFHRAFDQARDPVAALDTLIRLGVERVLTSGQAADAWGGRALLGRLVRHGAGRIEIMAGGSIQATQVADIVREADVRELHVGAQRDAKRLREVLALLQP